MDIHHRYAELPLDTPDNDPRWRERLDATSLMFHEPCPNDAQVSKFREFARTDNFRLRGMLADGTGLAPETSVATFNSTDKLINVGHGRMAMSNYITDVTVRTSHRRRGVLRTLMRRDLDEAVERGLAFASLTVSEGGIYGRFGFGVAATWTDVRVNTLRWKLREPATGRCEQVSNAELATVSAAVRERFTRLHRAAHSPLAFHAALDGGWDHESGSDNRKRRSVVHHDGAGEVDGFAAYLPGSDTETPPSVQVNTLFGATETAELALWDFLASMDLVEQLKGRIGTPVPGIRWALTDPRAVTLNDTRDSVWVRVLDSAQALSVRGWDSDGELTLRVVDPMGYADGTFHVAVQQGSAEVTSTTAEPDLTMDVEALGSAYFGLAPISLLAEAGRARGDVQRAGRLFNTVDQPCNLVFF